MTRFMLIASVAALISGVATTQAFATEDTVVETGTVRTSDLNLSTEQGARALLRRVTAKASDLCSLTNSPLARGVERAERSCVSRAVASSVARIDAPMVDTEFARQNGATPTEVAAR